jgi:hypothetical protein
MSTKGTFFKKGLESYLWIGKKGRIPCWTDPLANPHRAFLRNPVKYPDPDNYRPERWLEPEWPTYQEPLTTYPKIKEMTSFGWGQRQCVGQNLTEDELVVACGALAWCFNLEHKNDPATGKLLPVPLNKTNSLLILKPDPFQMAFEPRSETRKQEALRLWRESQARDLRDRAAFVEVTKESRST